MRYQLRPTVKRVILQYKSYIRKQDITRLAKRRYKSDTILKNRTQAQGIVNDIGDELDSIYDELDEMSRATALDILGSEELMREFVRKDKFGLTFSQKLNRSKYKIRKRLRDSIFESYDNELPAKIILQNAQNVWETTAEFIKFVAYMAADAWNFAKMAEILNKSKTGFFEIYLSDIHEKTDICDFRAGFYRIDSDVELPPYHPYCLCQVRYVDKLTAEEAEKNLKTNEPYVKPTNKDKVAVTESIDDLIERYSEKYPDKVFAITGGHPETMKPVLEEFDRLAEKFPKIANRIKIVSVEKMPEERYSAYATRDGRKIAFNIAYWDNPEEIRKQKFGAYATNWTVQTKDFEADTTMTHEFGHHMYFYASDLDYSLQLTDMMRLSNDVGTYGHLRKIFNATHPEYLAHTVSNYAQTNMDEAMAESFTASIHRIKEHRTEYDLDAEKFLYESAKLDNKMSKPYVSLRDIEQELKEQAIENYREQVEDIYARFGVETYLGEDETVYAKMENAWGQFDIDGNLVNLLFEETLPKFVRDKIRRKKR